MFGTFQEEEEKPTYGITKPLNSWNALFANFSHYQEMGKDLTRIPSWSDRIKYIFNKPGWLPKALGGYRAAPAVDKLTYRKYETTTSQWLNIYVVLQFTLALIGAAVFLFSQKNADGTDRFSIPENMFITTLISLIVVNCGVMFERKRWVYWAEALRIIFYAVLLIWYTGPNTKPLIIVAAIAYAAISFILLFKATKTHEAPATI
jgi:hypothetical protein